MSESRQCPACGHEYNVRSFEGAYCYQCEPSHTAEREAGFDDGFAAGIKAAAKAVERIAGICATEAATADDYARRHTNEVSRLALTEVATRIRALVSR